MKSIMVNGQMLASVESMQAEPVEYYARKRVGLFNSASTGTSMDVLQALQKFTDLETELNRNLIGMDEAVHVALLGLLSGDNVFLLSKPGAAKSTLAGLIGDSFGGGNHFFKKNFTPDMSMSDLYGPLSVEKIIRENGATPATIAIIGGRLKVGLTPEEIDYLGKTGTAVTKASRRDLAVLVSKGMDGATTVTTTMMIAAMAGIKVFATGGIGGVHRGAETTMDISADLEELANTPVVVVCAGAKAILDLKLTLEYLETHGVPVIGYGTEELPAFYSRHSGLKVDYRMDTPEECAGAFHVQQMLGMKGGMLVTNPIPEEYSMDDSIINKAIDDAIDEMNAKGIHGKEATPFLLAKVKELTGGDSLDSNIHLVFNNAKVASQIASCLCNL